MKNIFARGREPTVATWARAVETEVGRLLAVASYAAALDDAGEHAEGVRLERGVLDVDTRTLGPEHSEA